MLYVFLIDSTRTFLPDKCMSSSVYGKQKYLHMCTSTSVEKQVVAVITLYYLADEGRYRKVANAFGIPRLQCL